MPEFGRGQSVELGHGVTLHSVAVAGQASDARPVRTGGPTTRGAAPASPGAAIASAGVRPDAAAELGAAIDDSGMRLQSIVELPELIPPPASARRATGGPRVELEIDGRAGETQVLLEVDGTGHLRWHLPLPAGGRGHGTRAVGRGRFVVPVDQFPVGTPEAGGRRGGGRFGIRKVLHVLRFPVETAAGWVASRAVGLWENRYRPYGLHQLNPDGSRGADVTPELLVRLEGGPFLLLVHGLFGRSDATFDGLLTDRPLFRTVHDRYAGRVLVFDHPTLHVAPHDNAAWLRGQLPTDRAVSIDVVAHSRGGLIARQLGRQPGGPPPTIGTVVHVGVPNAGTVLASKDRLGALLDVVTNVVSLFPDPGTSITLEAVLEVVKQVAQGAFGGLEGVAAMDPADVELAALNELTAAATVRAITTDYRPDNGGSVAARALDVVVDALFGAANDLVVPTEGVFKAGSYVVSEPVVASAAGGVTPVTHTTFFRNADVREQLRTWLAP